MAQDFAGIPDATGDKRRVGSAESVNLFLPSCVP